MDWDEQTDEELDAEVASILRRPPDDPERLALESQIETCTAMMLYAKYVATEDGFECEPGECRVCGKWFTPPPHEAGAQFCSTACFHKCMRRGALLGIKFDRQRDAAERESQPT
jgi:hypothetical protein